MGFGWSLAVDCRGAGNGRMRYLSLWLFAQDLVSRFGPWDGRLCQAEAVRKLAHFRESVRVLAQPSFTPIPCKTQLLSVQVDHCRQYDFFAERYRTGQLVLTIYVPAGRHQLCFLNFSSVPGLVAWLVA